MHDVDTFALIVAIAAVVLSCTSLPIVEMIVKPPVSMVSES